jgi:hypothetical protein
MPDVAIGRQASGEFWKDALAFMGRCAIASLPSGAERWMQVYPYFKRLLWQLSSKQVATIA